MKRLFAWFVASALTVTACAEQPWRLATIIPLPGATGRLDHLTLDPKTRRLFVAALGNNSVEVVDLQRTRRVKSITGLHKPTGVLFVGDLKQLVVANGDSGPVQFYDAETLSLTGTILSVDDADNLRLDPKTKLAYVGYGAGALGVIDLRAGRVIDSIKLKAHPESFQLETNGPRIFVNVPDARQIAVIDREKRKVVVEWALPDVQQQFPMAFDEPKHRLFIGSRKPARVLMLDSRTGAVLDRIGISGDADDLFHDAVGHRLYVSCGEGFVDVLREEGERLALQTRIKTRAGARTSLFSAEFSELYLALPAQGKRPAEIRVFAMSP